MNDNQPRKQNKGYIEEGWKMDARVAKSWGVWAEMERTRPGLGV